MTHKTFPSPAIAEALCEIHFQLPEDKVWEATFGSQYFKTLPPEFIDFEPVIDMMLTLEQGAKGLQPLPLIPKQRLRYKHSSESFMLQLSENVFTFNQLKMYPGWVDVKKQILDYWGKLVDVVKPTQVNRIGLRYINQFPREKPDQRIGEWLKESEYVASCVLKSPNGFLSRVETKLENENRAIITLAPIEDNKIVFDIDCISEKKLEIHSLESEIENLHNNAWEIFSRSLTDKFEQFMKVKK